jgi:hypothetical protein
VVDVHALSDARPRQVLELRILPNQETRARCVEVALKFEAGTREQAGLGRVHVHRDFAQTHALVRSERVFLRAKQPLEGIVC